MIWVAAFLAGWFLCLTCDAVATYISSSDVSYGRRMIPLALAAFDFLLLVMYGKLFVEAL